MNVKRLNKLADFLDKLNPEYFDMEQWFKVIGNDKCDLKELKQEKVINECKTVACAMGWACEIPEFKKEGLKLDFDNEDILYKEYSGHDVPCKFFDLEERVATEIFYEDGYKVACNKITPKMVAKKIRAAIAYYSI